MSFIENEDAKFVLQILKFKNSIGGYAATLGITPAEVAQAGDDADYVSWVFEVMSVYHSHSENWTNFKNLIRKGKGGTVTTQPVPPVLPTAPTTVVDPNVQDRFSKLAGKCKKSPNYTKAIGEDLGIEATQTPFTPETGKPVFTIRLVGGGKPELVWTKDGFDGVEIQNKVGNVFQFLDVDMRPNYTDNKAIVAQGETKIFTYKMIYLYKDARVGSWSEEVSITVTGE